MSRIGKQPISIPAGVQVKLEDGNHISVKGPKGELQRTLPSDMIIEVGENVIEVKRPSDGRQHKSLHGLTRTLVANMVQGVTQGYERKLELVGTGYRATLQGSTLNLAVGFSHPVQIQPPDGISIEVPRPVEVIIRGINKELVGQVAADIRAVKPPEPYLGKGIRYSGERVRRKVGKTGKK